MIENYGFRIIDIFLTLPYITLQDQKMFHVALELATTTTLQDVLRQR